MSDGSVLDASALLAYLGRETGWEEVEATLPGALISSVNFAEVLSKMAERGGTPENIVGEFGSQLVVVSFTPEHALAAAQLRPLNRHLGLSLGDRACLALGLERRASVLTADRLWHQLDTPHRIEVIR